MSNGNRFIKLVDAITEKVGNTISLVALAVMLIIFIEVVSRYVFDNPTSWAWTLSTHLFGVLALFGGAYALLYGQHIRVEVLYERFGPRLKLVSSLLTIVCFFTFVGLLVWQGYEMAAMSIGNMESLRGTLHFPVYPLKTLIPIAAFLLLLQGLASFWRELGDRRTGNKDRVAKTVEITIDKDA
jgi:TRAP-type mannitol/chloroaromatic compound transport system permease small subunit